MTTILKERETDLVIASGQTESGWVEIEPWAYFLLLLSPATMTDALITLEGTIDGGSTAFDITDPGTGLDAEIWPATAGGNTGKGSDVSDLVRALGKSGVDQSPNQKFIRVKSDPAQGAARTLTLLQRGG